MKRPHSPDDCEFSGNYSSRSSDILFFSDLNLGKDEGWRIFSSFFPSARKLLWERGSPKAPLHQEIRRQSWLFTVSFYNDFVFHHDDFAFLGLPLNLHPALPTIRGLGHDYIPLIEGHPEHGGTLHYIEPPCVEWQRAADIIDTGRIIRVSSRDLSPNATYGDIRHANQEVMLGMLTQLCEQLLNWGCVATAHRELVRECNENRLAWGERYIGRQEQCRALEELKRSRPDHRAFNPKRTRMPYS